MDNPGHGPVETAWRAWVATLGELSPRQAAEAETLYTIAQQFDLRTEQPASAIGTLRRALTATVDRLMSEKGDPARTPAEQPVITETATPNVVPPTVVEAARQLRAERRRNA